MVRYADQIILLLGKMHYPDLEHCGYWDGQISEFDCRLKAVGWLENGFPFETGDVESWVVRKLEVLRMATLEHHFLQSYLGLHTCSLCNGGELSESNINIFVPAGEVVYAAPGRVDHYITRHGYLPPHEFLLALELSPVPGEPSYVEALRFANGGKMPWDTF